MGLACGRGPFKERETDGRGACDTWRTGLTATQTAARLGDAHQLGACALHRFVRGGRLGTTHALPVADQLARVGGAWEKRSFP